MARLESEVARTQHRGTIESQNIAWVYAGDLEGEADGVAWCDEVGPAVNVEGDVVAWLGAEEGEGVLDGLGDGGGGHWRRRSWGLASGRFVLVWDLDGGGFWWQ